MVLPVEPVSVRTTSRVAAYGELSSRAGFVDVMLNTAFVWPVTRLFLVDTQPEGRLPQV